MIRVLVILQSAFSMWMLVDAIQRGARSFWFLVVLMPFGEWVYFFMVKINDPEFDGIRNFVKKFTERKPTLKELRYRFDQAPSFANHLALGQALHDQESYLEAEEMFVKALGLVKDDPEALYGLALCQLGLEDYESGIETLQLLIEVKPNFRDYVAWKDLVQAFRHQGRADEMLETLDQLVTRSSQLEHRVLYAHYLLHIGRREEGRRQLELGLMEYQHAPKFVKKRDKAWVRMAKKMLRESAAGRSGSS